MAESIGNAYVNIVPKAPGIEGQIDSLLGGPAPSAGSSAGGKAGAGLLSSLKGVLTVAAVGKVLAALEGIVGGDVADVPLGEVAGVVLPYERSVAGVDVLYGDSTVEVEVFELDVAGSVVVKPLVAGREAQTQGHGDSGIYELFHFEKSVKGISK